MKNDLLTCIVEPGTALRFCVSLTFGGICLFAWFLLEYMPEAPGRWGCRASPWDFGNSMTCGTPENWLPCGLWSLYKRKKSRSVPLMKTFYTIGTDGKVFFVMALLVLTESSQIRLVINHRNETTETNVTTETGERYITLITRFWNVFVTRFGRFVILFRSFRYFVSVASTVSGFSTCPQIKEDFLSHPIPNL